MPEAPRLEGLRIVVTRPEPQAQGLPQALQAEGATVVLLPAVEIRVSPDLTTLDHALRRLEGYDWVIFTSANAVEITAERMQRIGVPRTQLAGRRVAAIDHAPSRRTTTAERAFLHALGAGCSAPVGAFAEPRGDQLHLRAVLADSDGTMLLRLQASGEDPIGLGRDLALQALKEIAPGVARHA